MADDDLNFDFERNLETANLLTQKPQDLRFLDIPAEDIGQQPGNYKKNFRQTVCTYWLRGLCMKGDTCGFLHQYDQERMPVCRTLLKFGVCQELDCPYKHDTDEIKECNMYKLGFCIYGPQCRYKHKKNPGPPPEPELVEAAKPRDARDINRVVNSVNPGVVKDEERPFKRGRPYYRGRDHDRDQPPALEDRQRDRVLALPAPPGPPPPGGQQGQAGDGSGGGRGRDQEFKDEMPPMGAMPPMAPMHGVVPMLPNGMPMLPHVQMPSMPGFMSRPGGMAGPGGMPGFNPAMNPGMFPMGFQGFQQRF
eukprot:CAMPEP_0202894432 /NCGR_PEP_ID=MMETSP1392-20130828/3849_1 /ASSEMBLY_ACC=CAM_ASM_000868 /TAXON_ID=225041 /ORGANISM="Chlamydomonas chlamydogama, Strain SAG 11-48b" /LENGTH=306 /DNA_ID=CAMNT_0049579137 /DNA_START=174 /DNA_END=1094 /DNA_ORIENTATION=-